MNPLLVVPAADMYCHRFAIQVWRYLLGQRRIMIVDARDGTILREL